MPAAARVNDDCVPHCSSMVMAQGSDNVFVNAIPWSRQSDVNTVHLYPPAPCPSHSAPITSGSPSVKVNTLGAGRVGDAITGCTAVAAGSPNVFAGNASAYSASADTNPVFTPQVIKSIASFSNPEEYAIASDDKSYPTELLVTKGVSTEKPAPIEETKPVPIVTNFTCTDCDGSTITESTMISSFFTLANLSSNAVVSKYHVVDQHGLTADQIKCNLSAVAKNCLDVIKLEYPSMIVTSGFRHGNTSSKHELGQATDIQIMGYSNHDYYNMAKWIAENVEFDALLLEFKNFGTGNGWIHISYRCNNNRGLIQTYFNNRKYSNALTLV